jgi:hypothetical protein
MEEFALMETFFLLGGAYFLFNWIDFAKQKRKLLEEQQKKRNNSQPPDAPVLDFVDGQRYVDVQDSLVLGEDANNPSADGVWVGDLNEHYGVPIDEETEYYGYSNAAGPVTYNPSHYEIYV